MIKHISVRRLTITHRLLQFFLQRSFKYIRFKMNSFFYCKNTYLYTHMRRGILCFSISWKFFKPRSHFIYSTNIYSSFPLRRRRQGITIYILYAYTCRFDIFIVYLKTLIINLVLKILRKNCRDETLELTKYVRNKCLFLFSTQHLRILYKIMSIFLFTYILF